MKAGLGEAEKAEYLSVHPLTAAGWFGWAQASAKEIHGQSHRGKDVIFTSKGGALIRWFPGHQGWKWIACGGTALSGFSSGDVVTLARHEQGNNFVAGFRRLREFTGRDQDSGETNSEPQARTAVTITGPTNPTLTPSETKTPPRETVANSADAQRPAFLLSPNPTQPASALAEGKKTDAEVREEYLDGSIGWSPEQGVPAYLVSRGIAYVGEQFRRQFRVSDKIGRCRFLYLCFGEGGDLERAGVESKGATWKSFTERGRAGVWFGGNVHADTVCVVESPVDALAHAAMTDFAGCYMSVRMGGEADAARHLSAQILAGRVTTILIATDNDDGGHHYEAAIRDGIKAARAERARLLREEHGKEEAKPLEVKVLRRLPMDDLKDWGDELKARLAGPVGDELMLGLEIRALKLANAWAAKYGEGDAELRPAA